MRAYWLEYRNALMAAHPNVRFFFAASFLWQLSGGFFSVLYNLYIKALGLPDTVAGACVSASSIAGALSLIPAGILCDKLGRRRMILWAGIMSQSVYALQPLWTQPSWMTVGNFVTGAIGSVLWVAALPLLAQNVHPAERMHLFSVNFALTWIAQVAGSLAAGTLGDALTHTALGNVWGLRVTLWLGAALGMLGFVPFARIREAATSAPRPQATDSAAASAVERVRQSAGRRSGAWRQKPQQLRLVLRFTAVSTCIGFGAGLVIPYLNLYFVDRFGMSKSSIGLVIACAQALTAVSIFVGPLVSRRIGPVHAVITFQLLSIPFLLLTGWTHSPWLAAGAVIIRQALMNCSNPIQDSIMMTLVDDDLKSFAVSCGQTAFTLGWAVMGPVSTHIVSHWGPYTGYAAVFSCTALLYLVGSVLYGISFGRYERVVLHAGDSAVQA